MSSPAPGGMLDALYAFFSHARLARVVSTGALSTVFLGPGIRALIGWPGYAGILATEVVVMALILVTRRRSVRFTRLMPLSLAVFLVWTLASVTWTSFLPQTIAGLVLQWGLTFLAIGVAATRDSMQIIRTVGSVLRVTLGLSLGLEILSGIVVRAPFSVWGISGGVALGEPIQGVAGSRNALATLALVGLVTFAIELRTRSISRRVGVFSLIGGSIVLLLTQSPVGYIGAVALGIMTGVIYLLRHMTDTVRRGSQIAVAVLAIVALAISWVFRAPLIIIFSAQGTMLYRVELWQRLWTLIQAKPLAGWGYVGAWPQRSGVFGYINMGESHAHANALNAYLDTLFQVGIIGFAVLAAVVGIALVRTWLLATTRKSAVFAWAPLILMTLLVTSLLESTLFTEWAWMLLVLIATRASHELSWRRAPRNKRT